MLAFAPTVMLKGDFVGHPFRGNQWGNPNDVTDADRQAAGIPQLNDVFDGLDLVSSNGYAAVNDDYLTELGDDSGLWDAMTERINAVDGGTREPFDDLHLVVVDNYTGSASGAINAELRGKNYADSTVHLTSGLHDPSQGTISMHVTDVVSQLDIAFDTYGVALPESVILYRGIGGTHSRAFTSLGIGQEFVDKGFISTTASPRMAADFALRTLGGIDDSDDGAVIEIHAPKGTPVMLPDANMDRGESEVMLNRGTKFRVTNITGSRNQFEGRHPDIKLIVEVVPQDKAA